MKELHPVQQQLLDKFGLQHQIDKLKEEMLELDLQICELDMYFFYNVLEFTKDGIKPLITEYKGLEFKSNKAIEDFYREFLDVRNLMQQIESKLDPILLEKYEAEMFEKAKKKYLDKGV